MAQIRNSQQGLAVATSIVICLSLIRVASCKSEASNRSNYVVPAMISFEEFVNHYGKHYDSPADALIHQKLFLARAVRATVSSIDYKQARSGYYLRVNHLSDLTAAELTRFMPNVAKAETLNAATRNKSPKKHEAQKNVNKAINSLPDRVDIDWRKGGCFTPVQNQGVCGSCFIFAALGLWEYVYCTQSGELAQFSAQFIIDCGTRRELKGCDGGEEWDIIPFMLDYGLELESNYPYRGLEDSCPYGAEGNDEQLGYYKVANAGMTIFHLDEMNEFLRISPVVFSMVRPPNMGEYGGGVFECMLEPIPDGHAMVVVGSGREEGKDYWIFRNSWGDDWGIDGYMKLNKNNTCMDLRVGGAPKALMYGLSFIEGKNPTYNPTPVLERYKNL